jgi:hypothetical protein
MDYVEFASKISFYEFLQHEFKKAHFDPQKYGKEIAALEATLTIDYLTKLLETDPKVIDIFEEVLQLKRFTNTQYINFCFDVNLMNNAEQSLVLKYILNSVFKFENGKKNESFWDVYCELCEDTSPSNQELIFFTKRAIVQYIVKLLRKRNILYDHISNSIGCRLRISKYLIENLNADELVSAIDLEKFLRQKRHPVDTKGLHGNFGNIKISAVLQDCGLKDISEKVPAGKLPLNWMLQNQIGFKGLAYIRERAIEGINKQKDRKPKKFDYIVVRDGRPRVVIETNFFSTAGTKIGINQGEYVDLNEDIKAFNRAHGTDLLFMWITDGNYWLSKDGETRFVNLKKNFFREEFQLMNYKLFREALPRMKKTVLKLR